MDIALLVVLNCKSDIVDRTLCNYMAYIYIYIYVCIVTCSNFFHYQFIYKPFVYRRIKL